MASVSDTASTKQIVTEATGLVSVVSVTYYTGDVLFDMIHSVLKQEPVGELVLVNNGNPLPVYHRLLEFAEKEPRLTLISGQGNVGFATATNLGVKTAKFDNILILNPDCVPEDDFVEKLIDEAQKLPRPNLVSCRILDQDGVEQSGSRRAMLTPWRAFIEVFSLYKLAPNHPHFQRFKWHENEIPKTIMEVPAISGATIFVTKEDFWKIGGFDEGYFLHVEDIDLCFRMRGAGGHVFFVPHLTIRHVGATSKSPKAVVEWHKTKSFVRYFFKNFSDSYPRFFLYSVAAAIWLRFFAQCLGGMLHFGKTGKKPRG